MLVLKKRLLDWKKTIIMYFRIQAPYNQITYKITESETTAINYFYLHPETGHVSLNQCTNDTDNRFIVNICYSMDNFCETFFFNFGWKE